jgi:queuine/archaeosine tRNA-ribosyltransferase
MADIYIVYGSENVELAEKLVELLSQQWKDVWWDKKIVGKFRKIIEKVLPGTGCVIAINSALSRDKDTYAEELRLADKHNIDILPILLDDAELPYPFGAYSYVDMKGWSGETDHRGFIELKSKLALIVPPKQKPQRHPSIAGGKIYLPNLFMSVSSFETQLTPLEAVRALRIFQVPTILVSAFDLVKRNRKDPVKLIDEIVKYKNDGGFVLIDSGHYEKSRLSSKNWNQTKLKEALACVPHDWTFCFDVMKPDHNIENAVMQIVDAVTRNKEFTPFPVLPIIHAPKIKPIGHQLENIPRIVRRISEILKPPLIAIPERELGAGLIARAIMVQKIRKELSYLPYYQPLHILGTGNPWSLAVLTAAGADTFDGLEWCRMAVDRDKNRLHHFQHYDFFKYQTEYADSSIARNAYYDPGVDFAGKVAFHNLDYFTYYINMLREYADDKMEAFFLRITDTDTTDQIKNEIPGIFK